MDYVILISDVEFTISNVLIGSEAEFEIKHLKFEVR